MTHLKIFFCPNHIFVISEDRHFKFRVLIDTEEYECVRDILLPIGMCSESRDLLKSLEISDNITETMQDRYIVARSLIGNRMWPIE